MAVGLSFSRSLGRRYCPRMKTPKPEIALSVRQPYAELILRGTKKIEYRSVSTSKRERVYIYASLQPGPTDDLRAADLVAGDLPTGVFVGTVEIQRCEGKAGDYYWHLARPERLKKLITPTRHRSRCGFVRIELCWTPGDGPKGTSISPGARHLTFLLVFTYSRSMPDR